MAHFAELSESNVVTQVVVVANAELLVGGVESEQKGVLFLQGLVGRSRWKQTSYNANGNPAKRYNYAGIGYTYDSARDAFIAPQPYASWTLDETKCVWAPPVPHPVDGKLYTWDEASGSWSEVGGSE
jgi:hypothetical protein